MSHPTYSYQNVNSATKAVSFISSPNIPANNWSMPQQQPPLGHDLQLTRHPGCWPDLKQVLMCRRSPGAAWYLQLWPHSDKSHSGETLALRQWTWHGSSRYTMREQRDVPAKIFTTKKYSFILFWLMSVNCNEQNLIWSTNQTSTHSADHTEYTNTTHRGCRCLTNIYLCNNTFIYEIYCYSSVSFWCWKNTELRIWTPN